MQFICMPILLFCLLVLPTTGVWAEDVDIAGQLLNIQKQMEILQGELKHKQLQVDHMQQQLNQLLQQAGKQGASDPGVRVFEPIAASTGVHKTVSKTRVAEQKATSQPAPNKEQRFQQPKASAKTIAAAPAGTLAAAKDDEVLFTDASVFASGEEEQAAWPGWLNTFNINGDIALRYESGSNQQFAQGFTDTFRLSDFNLDFSFEPTAKLDVNLSLQMQELKIKNPVREGQKIDSTSTFRHQFVVKYAFADYSFDQLFRLRFGAFLTPFGVYNESLYSDYNSKLVERPFVNAEIVPTPWTQLGAQLHGDYNLSPAWQLNYALYMSNGLEALQEKGAIKSSRIRDMSHQLVSRFNSHHGVGGRVGALGNSGQHQFEFGLSAFHSAWNPLATLNLNLFGSDLWYHYRGLDLRGEWALAIQDIAFGKQYDYGWYAQAAYRWRMLEPVFRFGRLRNRYVDQNGPFIDFRHRYSFGLNLYLGKFFVLKTAYSETSFSALRRHDHRVTSTLTAGF